MKKVTATKYVAGEWECWKDEKYHYWYIGKTGTNTYLAMTFSERNARLITAAPEMYRLLKEELIPTSDYGGILSFSHEAKIRAVLARIDGKEEITAHEGTE